jgi:thiamine biosynthesis protein ThiI
MTPVIVIHFAELTLKGKNRPFFIKILMQNIKKFLDSKYYNKISRREGKIVIEMKNKNFHPTLVGLLSKIPGISNVSFGYRVKPDLEEMQKHALLIAKENPAETFKIKTTRSDKKFKLNSMEVSRQVGGFVKIRTEMKVNAKKPELLISIEIAKDNAYVLGPKIKGPGGLPTGSSGKVICLMSGGIDSPVAAQMMMKRGANAILFHAQNKTITQKQTRDKIEKLAAKLSELQKPIKLYIAPFAEIQKQIIANTESSYRMIVYRRFMHRLAEEIRKKEKAKALVTGDNLAQVASQTMENLALIGSATDSLILRPVIGLNKQETIDLAEKIGTYQISILPYADCCSYLVAKHPQTKGKLSEVEKFEKNMKIDKLVREAIDKIEVKLFK